MKIHLVMLPSVLNIMVNDCEAGDILHSLANAGNSGDIHSSIRF